MPLASTTAVQTNRPPGPSVMRIVLLGSPVPLIVGVVSLTMAFAAGGAPENSILPLSSKLRLKIVAGPIVLGVQE